MSNELARVNGKQEFMGKEIPIIEGGFGENCRCVLAQTVSEIHDSSLREINQSIKRLIDKNRIREGVHYVDLKSVTNSDPLSEFNFDKEFVRKSSNIFLLSERGYSSLIKYMDDDTSWEVHDMFSEQYFAMRKQLKQELASYLIEDPIVRAYAWIEEQKQKTLLLEEVKTLTPLAEMAKKRIDKTGLVSITDITETFSLRKGQMTTWAKTNGYLHKTLQEVNDKGKEYFRVYGEEHKTVGVTENGIKLIDDHLAEIQNSPCRFVKFKNGESNE